MCSSCAWRIDVRSQRRKRVTGSAQEILSGISCIFISGAVDQTTISRATRTRAEETLIGVTELIKVNKIGSHGVKHRTFLILQGICEDMKRKHGEEIDQGLDILYKTIVEDLESNERRTSCWEARKQPNSWLLK